MAERKKRKRFHRLQAGGANPSRFETSQLKFYAYLIPICVVMALPILFIFFNALKPIDELFAFPPRFYVKRPTLQNFADLFALSDNSNVPVSRYLFNSVIITATVVVGVILLSISAGYVFSKKKFRLKGALFDLNTVALLFVPVAVAIPRYFVVVYTGLLNTFVSNILPLLCMPVCIFLIKQFIDQIPDALVEAAVIDGAGDLTIMHKIILPMTKPALSTVAILAFQSAWNSNEASVQFINNESIKSFAFFMTTLTNTTQNQVAGQGISAAATLCMFLPNLIVFIILQSKVMNTMAHSGLK